MRFMQGMYIMLAMLMLPSCSNERTARNDTMAITSIPFAETVAGPATLSPEKAQEEMAYAIGLQAYAYGYPWVYLPTLRWQWVTQPPATGSTPSAPLNSFWHARQLFDASYPYGGSPNNDTLYSMAWVDVGSEPVILSHPDLGERYFTFQMSSLDSDNFAYVGTRETGSQSGSFAIVGPGWKGTLPSGVTPLPPSRTPSVLIVGRTLVNGESDIANVEELQDKFTLVPLSQWGSGTPLQQNRNVWAPFDPKTDPLADFRTMNRAMTEEPPLPSEKPILDAIGAVGIGPGKDIDAMDEATKKGLARAAARGKSVLLGISLSGMGTKEVNGWKYPPSSYGRAGLAGDYLIRGALQCYGGIVANDPVESVYLTASADSDGSELQGHERYLLHFEPGDFPNVNAFWSLTMYGLDTNLVANAIDRYSIGDRTPGIQKDKDGGLTLYIQSQSPGTNLESNWLPSPSTGTFYLVLRAYLPGPSFIDQTWIPPAIARVK